MRRLAGVLTLLMGVSVTAAAPAEARPVWDTSPVHHARQVQPQPKVVDLRVARHPAWDRVVVDVEGRMPGYKVRYVNQLVYDGSGEPVPLKGRRFIAITLYPARAHDRAGHSTYQGPRLRQCQLPTLRGVALTGDFEGYVNLGLALRRRADFRVTVLHFPNRLVVDLRHQG